MARTTTNCSPAGMNPRMVARLRELLDTMDRAKHRTCDYHTEAFNEAQDTIRGLLEGYQIMTGETWELAHADSKNTTIYYIKQRDGLGRILPAIFDLISPT